MAHALSGRARAAAFAFLLTSGAVAIAMGPASNFYDGDSYYHLAVARQYWKSTLRDGLPWTRASAFASGFGDKELLFHVLLMPFSREAHSTAPGRAAIAVFAGFAAAAVAAMAEPVIGVWAAALPLGLLLGSGDMAGRMLRLRPEVLSLVWWIAAVEISARRRYRLLAPLAAAFVWSHTGFHVLLLICAVWFIYDGLHSGSWSADLLAYPLLGTAVGLVLHPQFPANIHIWFLQNVTRLFLNLPDAGAELQPGLLLDAVRLNAAVGIALLLLWASRERGEGTPTDRTDTRATYLLLSAGVSGLLTVWMSRFLLYFVPFATLGLLHAMHRSGFRVSSHVPLPRGRRVPLALALLILTGPLVARNIFVLHHALVTSAVYLDGREADARAFAAKIPTGGRVAARWSEAEYYVFWAPQGRYLNVLDPVFMAAWRPRAYQTLLAIFGGREPDIPAAVAVDLDSDFIAVTLLGPRILPPRLAHDPRVVLLHEGYDALFQIRGDANQAFVLDWRVSPTGSPPSDAAALQAWPTYPRAPSARGRQVEGFVDARRVASDRCVVFSRVESTRRASDRVFEFAPQGPSALWVDDRLRVRTRAEATAVPGQGLLVPIVLSAGEHVLSVETCPALGYSGFYLLERSDGAEAGT